MKTLLRCLLIEDSEDDARLVLRQLRDAGYEVTFERVDTPGAMRAALDRPPWDLVISDYVMPHFGGLAALELFRAAELDVPFIVVSGTIGEEVAVEAMKAGAHDYVMKDRLERLVPAVQRELREAGRRREARRVEAEFAASEVRYRRLFESSRDGILLLNAESGKIVDANPAVLGLLGGTRETFLGRKVWEVGCLAVIVDSAAEFDEWARQDYVHREDLALEAAAGRRLDVEFVSTAYCVDHYRAIQWNFRDITERRQVEAALREKQDRLNRFNAAAVGRELRMMELKREVNELCERSGLPIRHRIAQTETSSPEQPSPLGSGSGRQA